MEKMRHSNNREFENYLKKLRDAEDRYSDELNLKQDEINRLEERAKYYSEEHGKLRVRVTSLDNELLLLQEKTMTEIQTKDDEIRALCRERDRCKREVEDIKAETRWQ